MTHKQIVALAGKVYRWIDGAEDKPGPASLWEKVIRFGNEIREGKHALAELGIDPTPAQVQRGALTLHYGQWADALLTSEALVVDEDSRWRLIQELHRTIAQVAEKLKRNAEDDYTPDPRAHRFPEWQHDTVDQKGATTITDLFSGWEIEARAKDRSPKTIKEYKSIRLPLRHPLATLFQRFLL